MNNQRYRYQNIKHKYIHENFTNSSLFDGNYLNFGYWKNVDVAQKEITLQNRMKASQNLYILLIKKLKIKPQDIAVDLGSGKGHGAALMTKLTSCRHVIGIDLLEEHTKIACQLHKKPISKGRLNFITRPIELTKLPSESVDKLISIECIQHCFSMKKVSAEIFRIMKKGGTLAIATFFAENSECSKKLENLIPTLRLNIDNIVPIQTFIDNLKKVGFSDIQYKKIGNYVWKQYHKWIKNAVCKDSWDLNWLLAYESKFMDYYMVLAKK